MRLIVSVSLALRRIAGTGGTTIRSATANPPAKPHATRRHRRIRGPDPAADNTVGL